MLALMQMTKYEEKGGEKDTMCSTYTPFSLTPEDLENMAKESGMFWCVSCKKTFMKKNATECPNCGSKKIKPRAK
jgi:DNA-directed RNA polymerase subunit RPC12/RpoP